MNTGAIFSPCRQYRYSLFRRWSDPGVPAVFIMLNPSTADEVNNDPTVERCERRAKAMGFGALRVCNLFALRSTDPQALYTHADPIGPRNDEVILELVEGAGIVICAWGKHGNLAGRGRAVHAMLLEHGVQPHYLKLNQDGSPAHPLYIGYDVHPKLWEPA
jgi:hypothetical protein